MNGDRGTFELSDDVVGELGGPVEGEMLVLAVGKKLSHLQTPINQIVSPSFFDFILLNISKDSLQPVVLKDWS